MQEIIESFIGSNGLAMQLVSIGVLLGVLVKPSMDIARAIATFTKTKKDDELLDKVEGSFIYKKVLAFLNYLQTVQAKKK